MNTALIFAQTLARELFIPVLTGLIAFVLGVALAPLGLGAAIAFALVAAVVAGGLDTLYFHLLFSLRRAPAFAAEQAYQQTLADTRRRLQDGSMQMGEALIRRFEADYRRTAAITRSEGKFKRQLQEAKRRRRARLWVVERALSAEQLLAATTDAKTDAQALEHWSGRVDGMADVYGQVRQRLSLGAGLLTWLRPTALVAQVQSECAGLMASSVSDREGEGTFPLSQTKLVRTLAPAPAQPAPR